MSTYDLGGNKRLDEKLAATFKVYREKAWESLKKIGLVLDTKLTNGGPVGIVSDNISVSFDDETPFSENKISDILSKEELDDIKRGLLPLRSLSDAAEVTLEGKGLKAEFTREVPYCVIEGVDLSPHIIGWSANVTNRGDISLNLSLLFEGDGKSGCVVDGLDISELIRGWHAIAVVRQESPEIQIELFPDHISLKTI